MTVSLAALAKLMKKWHFHAVAWPVVVAVAVFAFGFGVGAKHLHVCGVVVDGAGTDVICGVKLTPNGEASLKAVARNDELGQGAIVTEHPPTAEIARLNKLAALQARVHYPTLAAPEPIVQTCWVQNFSSRRGQPPALFVLHDTESPNVSGRGPPGLQDVFSICAWFRNPVAQASSNYVTDGDGNTLQLVRDTDKAWTQAGFNAVALSDEMIGYASQTTWPFAQRLAVARLAAAEMTKFKIPIQAAVVDGDTCRVIRPGILMHLNLGQCGGGHHDAGTFFDVPGFITLVKRLTTPRPAPTPAWFVKAKTAAPMWAWFAWRDHGRPVALRPAQVPWHVPGAWWARYALHVA